MNKSEAELIEKLEELSNDSEVDMYSVATLNAYFEECANMIRGLLEEIQAYRAIGTPEEILAKFSDGTVTLEQAKVVIEAVMRKIEEYEEIGAVEECRVAVEKQRPKKPRLIGNAMICPSCPKVYSSDSVTYCTNCGQKLDWD